MKTPKPKMPGPPSGATTKKPRGMRTPLLKAQVTHYMKAHLSTMDPYVKDVVASVHEIALSEARPEENPNTVYARCVDLCFESLPGGTPLFERVKKALYARTIQRGNERKGRA